MNAANNDRYGKKEASASKRQLNTATEEETSTNHCPTFCFIMSFICCVVRWLDLWPQTV